MTSSPGPSYACPLVYFEILVAEAVGTSTTVCLMFKGLCNALETSFCGEAEIDGFNFYAMVKFYFLQEGIVKVFLIYNIKS